MLARKRTYIFAGLFLSLFCTLALAPDTDLGPMSQEMERVVQVYASPEYAQQCQEYAEKYTDPEFIDAVLYPDKKRLEELKAFGDRLIAEIPVQKWFGDTVPRIGVYNKDVCEVVFAGAHWALDHFLYRKLHAYFVDSVMQRIIAKRSMLLPLLNSSSDQSGDNCHPELDSGSSQNNQDAQLETELASVVRLRWTDLTDPRFCKIFATYFTSDAIIQAIKYHWLLSGSNRVGLLGFVQVLIQNAGGMNKQEAQSEPIALSSLCDINWLFQLPENNTVTNVLQMVNDFLSRHGFDNQVSRFLRNKTVEFVRYVTVNMLFVAWFSHYFMSVICARNMVKYKQEFKELLCAQDEHAHENLRAFVQEVLGMSSGLWKELRNQKLAEWQLYYNVLVLLPSCYNVAKIVYKIYVACESK